MVKRWVGSDSLSGFRALSRLCEDSPMTSDATHLPGDVLLARRQYIKLPPALSTPEHEAIAFLIWLDLQREGRTVAPTIEAFGVTAEEWRSLARLVGRELGQSVSTRSDSGTAETVARVKG